jgi:peroxiredoxin
VGADNVLLHSFLDGAVMRNKIWGRFGLASLMLIALIYSLAMQPALAKEIPAETRAIMKQAQQDLAAQHIDQHALKTGDKAPDFTLISAKGKTISLYQMLKEKPVILVFYRGGWCPYCNENLQAYQARLADIEKAGAKLIAISPQKPDKSWSTAEKNKLTFTVLSDSNNETSKAYHLLFTLPKALQKVYLSFGINLAETNDTGSWQLPIPATYVIDKTGHIIAHHVDINYKNRLPPQAAINALKAHQGR